MDTKPITRKPLFVHSLSPIYQTVNAGAWICWTPRLANGRPGMPRATNAYWHAAPEPPQPIDSSRRPELNDRALVRIVTGDQYRNETSDLWCTIRAIDYSQKLSKSLYAGKFDDGTIHSFSAEQIIELVKHE